MGNLLSVREQKALKPHLQGIEPSSLAAIILDSINLVGVDDDVEKLGIHFMNDSEFEEGGQARVIFWDEIEATDMPRKVFLEILQLVGEEIVEEYENNYDLDKSTDLGTAVKKLQVALVSLRETIDTLTNEEDAKAYRERLDSGEDTNEDSLSGKLIQEIRSRRGSYMWTNGEAEGEAWYNSGRRVSKGIEGVIDRLPDLRRRYDRAVGTTNKPLERVRQKIKILNMFHKGSDSTETFHEEDEIVRHPRNSMRRKSTLSVTGTSPILNRSRSSSRSSSVSSYDSTKQLLPTDNMSTVAATSLPSITRSLSED